MLGLIIIQSITLSQQSIAHFQACVPSHSVLRHDLSNLNHDIPVIHLSSFKRNETNLLVQGSIINTNLNISCCHLQSVLAIVYTFNSSFNVLCLFQQISHRHREHNFKSLNNHPQVTITSFKIDSLLCVIYQT